MDNELYSIVVSLPVRAWKLLVNSINAYAESIDTVGTIAKEHPSSDVMAEQLNADKCKEEAKLLKNIHENLVTLLRLEGILPGKSIFEELEGEILKRNDSDEFLDGFVHDTASQEASSVNNQGIRGQLEYLFGEIGEEEAVKQIRQMLEETK